MELFLIFIAGILFIVFAEILSTITGMGKYQDKK